jgi:hypothetical protein
VNVPPNPAEEAFQARSKELFDESVERLDGRTRSKLTQARHAALEELRAGSPRWRGFRLPAAGLATLAVAAVLVVAWTGLDRSAAPLAGPLPLDDLDIVADSDNLEMLQDVEFYAWLEDTAVPDPHSG